MIILDGLLALFLTSNFKNVLPVLGVTCLITFLRMMMKLSTFIDTIYKAAEMAYGKEENKEIKKEESK